jgi:thiol:disulfide interchange protein
MFLWGLPFALFSGFAISSWRPTEAIEWIGIVLLAALGILAIFLMYISVFGSEEKVNKAADWVSDGGDILGFLLALAVALVALPITGVIRVFRPKLKD